MSFRVITNPDFPGKGGKSFGEGSSFTNYQFRKLDTLFSEAAKTNTLTYRAVDWDYDKGIASYTYHKTSSHTPLFQVIKVKVGPQTTMYELFGDATRGKIAKSEKFESVYERLRSEIEDILPKNP